MRNILLTLSVVLLCIGCQKDDVDTGFKVSTKRVTLSHEAGEFTIEFNNSQYMTDTPDILIDYGIEQEYYTVNYEWLEVVEKTPRKATFRYQSNSFPRNRSAIIKVKNRYFSEFTEIKVEQEWVGEMPIEMEISNVNTRSFDINVETDGDMYTIMSTGSVSLSTTMEEHELICLYNVSSIAQNLVRNYNDYSKSSGRDALEMMMEEGVCAKGSVTYVVDRCNASRRYRTIVAGVKFTKREDGLYDVETVTPAAWAITDIAFPECEDVGFDVTFNTDESVGSDVDITVKPKGWDGDYYYMFTDPESYSSLVQYHKLDSDEALFKYFSNSWNISYNFRDHYSKEENYEYFHLMSGENTTRHALPANAQRVMIIFAIDFVDGAFQVVSVPKTFRFSVSQHPGSNMTFDMTIDEVHGRMVKYRVQPTNNTDGYMTAVLTEAEFNEWNSELLAESLADQALDSGVSYKGAVEHTIDTLMPETNYYLVAVGCHGGVTTTELAVKTFTTPSQGEPDCRITGYNLYGSIRSNLLYSLYPERFPGLFDSWQYDAMDMCMIGLEAFVEGEHKSVQMFMLADEEVEGVDDEQIIAKLRERRDSSIGIYYCAYNANFRFYAMAVDADGDVDLYVSDESYCFTREGNITDKDKIAQFADFYERVHSAQKGANSGNAEPSRRLCVAI